MIKILILGGTTEAMVLARVLEGRPGFDVVMSLAGRTRNPSPQSGSLRIGGFGGVDGLTQYLHKEAIDVLVDATHPFAAQMSRHAKNAAKLASIPRLKLLRPLWEQQSDDHWIEVTNVNEAAASLRGAARRVFLTSGHKGIDAFVDLDECWFLIRTIEPLVKPLPRHWHCLTARGPFDEASELALLKEHRIDSLVTKASGGRSTYAKIAAARRLGLPVLMIQRPPPPRGPIVQSVDDALTWLVRLRH